MFYLVYLHFVKALDSANHRFELAKLKAFGIEGYLLSLTHPCLSGRSYSALRLSGVPQVSVIGTSMPVIQLELLEGINGFVLSA